MRMGGWQQALHGKGGRPPRLVTAMGQLSRGAWLSVDVTRARVGALRAMRACRYASMKTRRGCSMGGQMAGLAELAEHGGAAKAADENQDRSS